MTAVANAFKLPAGVRDSCVKSNPSQKMQDMLNELQSGL